MRVRRRTILWAGAGAGLALLLHFEPIFHVVRLDQIAAPTAGAFDATRFVDRFWTERLIPAAARAADATTVAEAIQRNKQAACTKYGRPVGVGGVYCYFIAGTGKVVSLQKDSVGLSLLPGRRQVQVSLVSGNVFGNAVRDGTGLLDARDYPDSQDYNALSSEIDHRIERQVLPVLRRRATVGAAIRFAGCAEVQDEDTDLHPLRVVPFLVEVP